MKSTRREVADLEAELLRLNTLVRQRRAQLARLEACPNKGCECRKVWREVVEHKLASQVRKIRKNVSVRNGSVPSEKAARVKAGKNSRGTASRRHPGR